MTQPPGKKASITKKCEMLINVEEIGLGSWKLAFRLIFGWGIRWCTQNRNIFETWYHLWRHSVPLGPKKCQMSINVEEIGLGSWKLAFRLIFGWGIRWCTQNRKIFKTWYHLWRHSVPLGPKKCQMSINFEEIGLGSWKLAFRLIFGWGIRWCTQNRNIFKTWYYLWRHSVPLGHKKCQISNVNTVKLLVS